MEIYGPGSEKTIDIKHLIVTILLESKRIQEAIKELLEIEQLEIENGHMNLELAKTLKIIGTLYGSQGEKDLAYDKLREA